MLWKKNEIVLLEQKLVFTGPNAKQFSSIISEYSSRISNYLLVLEIAGFTSLFPLAALSSIMGFYFFYTVFAAAVVLMYFITVLLLAKTAEFYKDTYSCLLKTKSAQKALSAVGVKYYSMRVLFYVMIFVFIVVLVASISVASSIIYAGQKLVLPVGDFILVGLVLGGFTGAILAGIPLQLDLDTRCLEDLGALVKFAYNPFKETALEHRELAPRPYVAKVDKSLKTLLVDLTEVGETYLTYFDLKTAELVVVSSKWIYAEKIMKDWCTYSRAWILEKPADLKRLLADLKTPKKYFTVSKLKKSLDEVVKDIEENKMEVRAFNIGKVELSKVKSSRLLLYVLKAYSTILILLIITAVLSLLA